MIQFYTKKCLGMGLLLGALLLAQPSHAQGGRPTDACTPNPTYLYWVGDVDQDFFNEQNWRETVQKPGPSSPGSGTAKPDCLPGANKKLHTLCLNTHDPQKDKTPKPGTLDPDRVIGLNLYIENASVSISADIRFGCPDYGLTLSKATITSTGMITHGVISLDQETTLRISSSVVPDGVKFDFQDAASWIYWLGQTPDQIQTSLDDQVLLSGQPAVAGVGFRIQQYYQKGSLIRPADANFPALTVFSSAALSGNSSEVPVGFAPALSIGENVQSFVLKRGHMATLAVNENGTGKSKVFIASEADLVLTELPAALAGNVRFIRVMPWNWVTKKGTGGLFEQLDAGWFYNWNFNQNTKLNQEYVPMAWGASGALPGNVRGVVEKPNVTHFLGFNESDNCSGESGQFNNLCKPEVAVAYFEGLMKSGMRIGSPAPRENGPTTWLKEFYEIAKKRDVRFDFVAVHWYDWGSSPTTTPNADPQVIFNRFKNYLENVYSIYQMPIWITEFNANPNRGNATQEAFLKLALPYLESLPYVERYAYFQPMSRFASVPTTSADYLDSTGNLTNIGRLYLAHSSTPSIPAATYAPGNSLLGLDQALVRKAPLTRVWEAECGQFLGTQWDVVTDHGASNGLYVQGNTQVAAANPVARQVHFEFDLTDADVIRVWVRGFSTPGSNGVLRVKMDEGTMDQITPLTSGTMTWFQVPRHYTLGRGKHRLTIEFTHGIFKLDQVGFINGPEEANFQAFPAGTCLPASERFGAETTQLLQFFEAEQSEFGGAWAIAKDGKAIGGTYVQNTGKSVSPEEVPASSGQISWTFQVEKADEYELWAKIQAFEPSGVWISVDNAPYQRWEGIQNAVFRWYWKKFHYSYETENRSFSYFFTPGTHTVRIAYGTGLVQVDRLALATKGIIPSDTDPDVVNLVNNLVFEAEEATLLGNSVIVSCANSSNGKQVNLGNVNTNGVLFDQIVAETAGEYVLKIAYMSAAARTLRVLVNGENVGRQSLPRSGEWCFNNGKAGIWEVRVTLKEGANRIQLTPFEGDAPFLDKIALVIPEPIIPFTGSWEAEEAELVGAVTSPACVTASKGKMVNMGFNVNHAIRFNQVQVAQAGVYQMRVQYFSAVVRNLRVVVNGAPTTYSFEISGPWCGSGGSPTEKVISLNLQAGVNQIQLTPISGEAPIIDKIIVTNEVGNTVSALLMGGERFISPVPEERQEVFPNPVQSGRLLHVNFSEGNPALKSAPVRLMDLKGRSIPITWENEQTLRVPDALQPGFYILQFKQGISHKIWVE